MPVHFKQKQKSLRHNSPTSTAQTTDKTNSHKVSLIAGKEKADVKTPPNDGRAQPKGMSQETSASLAVIEYRDSPDTTVAIIAREHGFTAGALSYWARKFGLPLRRRGRRPLLQPTSAGRRILELVRAHGASETARMARMSKQRVHQIVSRWEPRLKKHRKAPKFLERPRRERRPLRTVVVSFRISNEELLRLSTSEITSARHGLSAYEKAREIVLKFIAPPDGESQEPIQRYLGSPARSTNTAAVKRKMRTPTKKHLRVINLV